MNTGLESGDVLLDDLRDTISTYCVLPSEAHLDAVTLWVATTHALPAFDYATRLVVRSAEKRSGKSRLLEIIDGTCHKPLRAVNATVAAIFRSLEGATPPTLLLDEADTIFGTRKVAEQNEDLRGLLNAGFQRGLPVLRTVGPQHTPTEFATFAMCALAGIGSMPDTIEDRAVVVVMRRRKPSEQVQPYRIRRDQPKLHHLRERLANWTSSVIGELENSTPDLPVEDRAADTWEPLVAVADMAGGTWPERARHAALQLTGEAAEASEDDSLNLKLLRDIQQIFDTEGASFVASNLMIERLHDIEESPWKDWELTPSKLGHRLKEYGIRTAHNTTKTQRGYRREDFQDTFDRYTRPKASEPVQTLESRGKVPDTFGTPDALKASGTKDPSGSNPHDSNEKHLRTPSDRLPAGTAPTYKDAHKWKDCTQCHDPKPVETLDNGICTKCVSKGVTR